MNFLKRAGAILMVVAIFASSCNKYADDFDQVNTKLDALATQVAGISTITTDMTALKSQITALQTTVASLPTATQQTAQFAAVTTQLTAMTTAIAAIDTQVKAVAATGTATKAQVDKLVTDLAALSKKVSDENAILLKGQADAAKALTALDVKVTGLDEKMVAMAKTMTDLAAAVAKVQMGVDANGVGIAALVVKLNDQATAIAKIGTDLAANTAADVAAATAAAAAVVADAAANASLMASNADLATKIAALQVEMAKTGTTTDTVAALTIKGLQMMLDAQKAQLDIILANTTLTFNTVTLSYPTTPGAQVAQVGVTATATTSNSITGLNVSNASINYTWQVSANGTSGWADIAGATSPTYMIDAAQLDKYIRAKAVGFGSYMGSSKESGASAKVIDKTSVGIIVAPSAVSTTNTDIQVDNALKVTLAPANATVSYQWQKASTATGTYSNIDGATSATYTPKAVDAGMYIKVVLTGINGFKDISTSANTTVVKAVNRTSPNYPSVAGNNKITITLTDGTFKGSAAMPNTTDLTIADFTFAGADASKFISANASVTKTSATTADIQFYIGNTMSDGAVNTVTVLGSAMVTQASAVGVVATTVLGVPVPVAIVAVTTPTYTMLAHYNTVKVTVANQTLKAGIVASDLVFAGADAAFIAAGTITNTGTVITISGIATGLTGTNNTIQIKAATITAQTTASAPTVAASATPANVTSGTIIMTGQNSVTFNVVSGVVKSGIAQANLTFAGTDAAALAAGTVNYISATSFSVTGLAAGLVGTNNTITLLASGQDAPTGTPVSISGTPTNVPVAVTSPVFTTSAVNNQVVITLAGAGATFKTGITVSDFTFVGADGAVMTAGTVTYLTSTTAAVTFAASAAGSNTVTAKASAFATTGATGITVAASTLADVGPTAMTIGGAGNSTMTLTLTGGIYKAGTVSASSFTFTGADAALWGAGSFTRTSNTVVTVTIAGGVTAGAASNVTVAAGAMATQATAIAGVTL